MNRTFSLCVALLAVGLFVVIAQGNPLSQIKQAANETRDAAESKSEEIAKEAEGHEKHDEHASHDDHHDHAKHDDHSHGKHHDDDDDDDDDDEFEVEVDHAVAIMIPTEGNNVRGVIRFDQTKMGVRVTASVSGLNPNQKHGFHIHEFGDISDPAGKATGGHYNPQGHDHALPHDHGAGHGHAHARHAGDLGNLQADADGNATFDQTFDNISVFDDDFNPIIGRGVIIHAQPDDGGQPTGNAGARISQGVIGVANTK
ncbi:superoxide dismutase family protein [Algisphaera agarilytica]|uniref:Cu/Zn superoxide dismutase n=1 Tax=Algisphaera agarilytica TaxID=1385975 RepID=A0A7X0H8P0_9BACT|nr:superoxide dismutase family protein [Algisphaera agarilytica]MBB6430146.1 Cu/Zn superoxide dismutase [Algisphaera agarilytica]